VVSTKALLERHQKKQIASRIRIKGGNGRYSGAVTDRAGIRSGGHINIMRSRAQTILVFISVYLAVVYR